MNSRFTTTTSPQATTPAKYRISVMAKRERMMEPNTPATRIRSQPREMSPTYRWSLSRSKPSCRSDEAVPLARALPPARSVSPRTPATASWGICGMHLLAMSVVLR